MAILSKGHTFGATDQVTSTRLNNLVDASAFVSGGSGTCVSGGGLEVTTGGQLQVKDVDISAAKLATNSVETAKIKDANVTKAKIENLANLKALGNVSGGAAAPQEVTINDTDAMSDASATTLATSESIKAYIDKHRPKYIALTGGTTGLSQTAAATYTYNIADFTGSGLTTGYISQIYIQAECNAQNDGGNVIVTVNFGDGEQVISRATGDNSKDAGFCETLTPIPINSDTSSFTVTISISGGSSTAAVDLHGAVMYRIA